MIDNGQKKNSKDDESNDFDEDLANEIITHLNTCNQLRSKFKKRKKLAKKVNDLVLNFLFRFQ